MAVPHKACTKCGEDKLLSEYYRDKRARDGLRPSCKNCHDLMVAAYKAAHPDRVKATAKAWAAAHPEECRIKGMEYKATHRERLRAHKEQYYRTAAGQATRARGKAKRRIRMLRTDATVALTTEEWQARIAEYGGRCCWCGKKINADTVGMDHIVALANGGRHIVSNVAPSCPTCNRLKGIQDWGYPHPDVPRDEHPESGSEWL